MEYIGVTGRDPIANARMRAFECFQYSSTPILQYSEFGEFIFTGEIEISMTNVGTTSASC